MKLSTLLVALAALVAAVNATQDLIVLDCGGRIHYAPSSDFTIVHDTPQNLLSIFEGILRDRMTSLCPGLTSEEWYRLHWPGPAYVLNMMSTEPDTSTICPDGVLGLLPNEVPNDFVALPPGCSYDNWVADGSCTFQVESQSAAIDLDIQMTVAECPNQPHPYMSLTCSGDDCNLIGRPCATNADCDNHECMEFSLNDTHIYDLFREMNLFDESDPEDTPCDDDVIQDTMSHILSWYTDAAAPSGLTGFCMFSDENVEEVFDFGDDPCSTLLTGPNVTNTYCNAFSNCTAECDTLYADNGWYGSYCAEYGFFGPYSSQYECINYQPVESPWEQAGCYSADNTFYQCQDSYPVERYQCDFFTAWDGTLDDGTSTTAANRLDGSLWLDEVEYIVVEDEVMAIQHTCDNTVVFGGGEPYATLIKADAVNNVFTFISNLLKDVQDCRGNGNALTWEQFRIRYQPWQLDNILYSFFADQDDYPLGKDQSDWVFFKESDEEENKKRSAFTRAADYVGAALGSEDSTFNLALDYAQAGLARMRTPAGFDDTMIEWLTNPDDHWLTKVFGAVPEKIPAATTAKTSTRSLLQDPTTYAPVVSGTSSRIGARFTEVEDCTLEDYQSTALGGGCRIKFNAVSTILEVPGSADIYFRVQRCSSNKAREAFPMVSISCAGAVCESLFRPQPCSVDSDCPTSAVICEDLADSLGDEDAFGRMFEQYTCPSAETTAENYWELEMWEQFPDVLQDQDRFHAELRSFLLYAGGLSQDGSSDLKFCLPEFDVEDERFDDIEDEFFEIEEQEDSWDIVTFKPAFLEGANDQWSDSVLITVGVNIEDFDPDNFVLDVAWALNLNPARITIASWEAASVVVDTRIRQPLGYDPEDPDDTSDVDELVSELEDIIDENGGLPSKTTGQIYTIEAFESSYTDAAVPWWGIVLIGVGALLLVGGVVAVVVLVAKGGSSSSSSSSPAARKDVEASQTKGKKLESVTSNASSTTSSST